MKKPIDIKEAKTGILKKIFGFEKKTPLSPVNPTRTNKVEDVKNPSIDPTVPRYNSTEIQAVMGRASRNVDNTADEFFTNLSKSDIKDDLTDEQASQFAHSHHVELTANVEPRPPSQDALIEKLNPKWLRISDLPSYMQQAIRGLGRQVFKQFTKTSIEEIDIICTVTHDEAEVRAVMAWISKNGIRDDQAKIDFSRFMMGMVSNTQLWNTPDHTWLLVEDHAGYYIYRWAGGRAVTLPSKFTPLQIKQIEELDFDENEPF